MNYLPFALLAYLLNSIAVTIDKFLLTKAIPNPLTYVFYISALSMFALLALPFTHLPSSQVFILASVSTLLWTLGAYFMFKGLRVGQISRVIPVIGTLTPLFLLIYAAHTGTVTINETWAAGILLLGLIFVTAENWRGTIKRQEIIFELLTSLLFAISYILLKEAYLRQDFLTVLVWSRWILVPFVIIAAFLKHKSKIRLNKLFLVGQTAGATSQLLLTFAIYLASPAKVLSLQGVQYVFLFIFGLIIFKEKNSKLFWSIKILGIILISLGLFILAFSQNLKSSPNLGVTYSPRYAEGLGLDPKITFVSMLDKLKVKRIRLPVYWDEIETFPQNFRFSTVDYYLNEALKRKVQVILVLGYRQPRWPECFAPVWVIELPTKEREVRILDLIAKEVEHFKSYPNIYAWQIENEPLFSFGTCDEQSSRASLKKEIEIVRNTDSRPVLITDSGELSSWTASIGLGDLFGTTLYRSVWNPLLGSVEYPLPPFFYNLKEMLARIINQSSGQTIISELQAEPWIPAKKDVGEVSISEQAKLFPASKLSNNLNFAKETGFQEIYLWGVEWWYFMATHGHPEYLQYAKSLFTY